MNQLFKVEPSKNPSARMVAERAMHAIREAAGQGQDFQVSIGEVKRTLDANAVMWASLADFTRHVGWMVTDAQGKQTPATSEDVKAILTAAFEKETRMAPGLNGGMVFLSARTSQFSKRKMGEFLTFLHAEGDERGVQWSDKALEDLAMYAPAERVA